MSSDYFVPRWTPPANPGAQGPTPDKAHGATVCAVCRFEPEDHDHTGHAPVWVSAVTGLSVEVL